MKNLIIEFKFNSGFGQKVYSVRFQSFETSFLMELSTSPTCFKASSAHLYNSHYLVTLTYWSGFLTGSPRPIASLSPGNLSDRQILRLQNTSTESETLLCSSGICFNKPSKGIQIQAKVCESCVAFGWLWSSSTFRSWAVLETMMKYFSL